MNFLLNKAYTSLPNSPCHAHPLAVAPSEMCSLRNFISMIALPVKTRKPIFHSHIHNYCNATKWINNELHYYIYMQSADYFQIPAKIVITRSEVSNSFNYSFKLQTYFLREPKKAIFNTKQVNRTYDHALIVTPLWATPFYTTPIWFNYYSLAIITKYRQIVSNQFL